MSNGYKSNTERAAELQEKALSIRDYMQEPDTMKQIMAALPKWLRADNFIRLFYTAMMQNTELLECTKQSLLSCMIQAAQIGLEPVLGKAALIPYAREVQFQPMYKGLIEVARRFAYISITAHVVYEVDEFDMSWGDDEKIIHIPDFRNPEREESAKLGAYDVWKGDDKEVISRRFMPQSDIIHIRDTYSKAWAKKGAKSVWGLHEDEMFIKTVIKNHCKLEPQCIEMERAVSLDDRAELQKTQLGMGSLNGLPMPSTFDFDVKIPEEEGEPPKTGDKKQADIVKTLSAQYEIPVADINTFVTYIAKKREKTEEWVRQNALESPDSFARAVKRYTDTLKAEKRAAKTRGEPQGKDDGKPTPNPAHIKEWSHSRKGQSPSTGLRGFVMKNLERIWTVYKSDVRDLLIAKFKNFYPGEVFPEYKKPIFKPPTTNGKKQETEEAGASGADDKPPFDNPLTRGETEGEQGEQGPSVAEEVGKSIRDAADAEKRHLSNYENAVDAVLKFQNPGDKFTANDIEKFMEEQAHMEGLTVMAFKADVMKMQQFPEYFDKFRTSIGMPIE